MLQYMDTILPVGRFLLHSYENTLGHKKVVKPTLVYSTAHSNIVSIEIVLDCFPPLWMNPAKRKVGDKNFHF